MHDHLFIHTKKGGALTDVVSNCIYKAICILQFVSSSLYPAICIQQFVSCNLYNGFGKLCIANG
jgi:hypothetical protein